MRAQLLAQTSLVCLLSISPSLSFAQSSTGVGIGVGVAKSNSASQAVAISGQGGQGGAGGGGGSGTATSNLSINSAAAPATQTINSNLSGSTRAATNAAVFAPGLAVGAITCLGSVSGGAGWVGGGFTLGSLRRRRCFGGWLGWRLGRRRGFGLWSRSGGFCGGRRCFGPRSLCRGRRGGLGRGPVLF